MATRRIVPRILVAGRTGAGKSSLLNALLGKEAFQTGVRPTTMGFDVQTWSSPWGEVEVIDSRGFAEADSAAVISSGTSVIQKGYEEAHVCLFVIPAGARDFERESRWVHDAQRAGLFHAVPGFLVVSRIDEVAPVRDWNPTALNLQAPRTQKEINICGKLDYIKSLSAFAGFFHQGRVIPVSSGQRAEGDDPSLNVPPFGIATVQEAIFQSLPEIAKIEYARLLRSAELANRAVQKLISGYVIKQSALGVLFYALAINFTGAAFTFGIFGDDAAVFPLIGIFLSFLVLPVYLQFLMVRQIAVRHGLGLIKFVELLKISRRFPGFWKNFNPRPVDWVWILVAIFCCCNPVGIGLFLTRPIAHGFNQVFYHFKVNTAKGEPLRAGDSVM